MTDKNVLEEGNDINLQFSKRKGLLPVVVQEKTSGRILMVGYVNQEALEHTISTKQATFWSTSRQKIWTKGETSGDYLRVMEILVDCDQDALVYQVEMLGDGVCHTRNAEGKSRTSCFYRKISWNSKMLTPVKEMV